MKNFIPTLILLQLFGCLSIVFAQQKLFDQAKNLPTSPTAPANSVPTSGSKPNPNNTTLQPGVPLTPGQLNPVPPSNVKPPGDYHHGITGVLEITGPGYVKGGAPPNGGGQVVTQGPPKPYLIKKNWTGQMGMGGSHYSRGNS